ncbi:hypothetical protein Pan153_13910 [Gimesia panareensis]|uniref:Uncharacterized protein n=1 Tax=Gimesia panareensis TaxID=2527978 RepID=A0A518FK87_9PLAN|nr:hypothetical protein [Gimesia panareensis]QDV16759.1 hypothetical protein Pan153_13910 [Gimesia panareensis]
MNGWSWIEIIPPLPEKEAIEKLAEWKATQQAIGVPVNNESIRRDQILSSGKTVLIRYCLLHKEK